MPFTKVKHWKSARVNGRNRRLRSDGCIPGYRSKKIVELFKLPAITQTDCVHTVNCNACCKYWLKDSLPIHRNEIVPKKANSHTQCKREGDKHGATFWVQRVNEVRSRYEWHVALERSESHERLLTVTACDCCRMTSTNTRYTHVCECVCMFSCGTSWLLARIKMKFSYMFIAFSTLARSRHLFFTTCRATLYLHSTHTNHRPNINEWQSSGLIRQAWRVTLM